MPIPGSFDYLFHRFNGSLSFAITLRVMWRGRKVPDSPLLGEGLICVVPDRTI